MEQLPEYLCLKEKEDVYNCTIIDTEQDFSNIFQNIIDNQSNYVFRSVNEAKFKLYSSAQRQWIWNDLSNKYTSYKDYINSFIIKIQSHQHIVSFFQNNHIPLNDFVILALLQHYSQPSPLIDFPIIHFSPYFLHLTMSNPELQEMRLTIMFRYTA